MAGNPRNSPALRLSVLDQAPISEGSNGGQALRNSIDLASLADRLGYHRYWLAEHHATPMLACASPEALIGPVAAATRHLRVGSGGVMLPHYSPVKVAETFSMLAGLYPGRIDLGIGRAPGSDQRSAYALQRDRRQAAPDDFPEQLTELLAYLEDQMPPAHPFAKLAETLPGRPDKPDIWLLGSSPQSGIWAAELGLPYMFADFISPHGEAIAARYREEFTAGLRGAKPEIGVAVSVVCAASDEEAWRLSASVRMAIMLLRAGRLIAVPSVETAIGYLTEEAGSPDAGPKSRRMVTGAPESVRREIEAIAREYGAEEVMIVTITHDHQCRRRSYELIAEAFGLLPAGEDS
ncbi:MAG TPA: LLM class flavin-dependent oxidoreductase [Candidatus Udaeobacter sp.]|nr:LLM class flavin-dependent oxidoreductase [Candidatus Udaeobacter sp.]